MAHYGICRKWLLWFCHLLSSACPRARVGPRLGSEEQPSGDTGPTVYWWHGKVSIFTFEAVEAHSLVFSYAFACLCKGGFLLFHPSLHCAFGGSEALLSHQWPANLGFSHLAPCVQESRRTKVLPAVISGSRSGTLQNMSCKLKTQAMLSCHRTAWPFQTLLFLFCRAFHPRKLFCFPPELLGFVKETESD